MTLTPDLHGAGESGTSYDNASYEDDSSYVSDGVTNSSSDATTSSSNPESGSFSEADESMGDSCCITSDSCSISALPTGDKGLSLVHSSRPQDCDILRCDTSSSNQTSSCCNSPPAMQRPATAAAVHAPCHKSGVGAPSARSPTRGRKHGAAAAGRGVGRSAACASQCHDTACKACKACTAAAALEEAQQSVEAREEEVACLHEALRKTAERARGLEARLGNAVRTDAIGGCSSSKCKHCDVVQGQLEVTSVLSTLRVYLYVCLMGTRCRRMVGGKVP